MSYLSMYVAFAFVMSASILLLAGDATAIDTYGAQTVIGNTTPASGMMRPDSMIMQTINGLIQQVTSTPFGWVIAVFASVAALGGLLSNNPLVQTLVKVVLLGLFMEVLMMPVYFNYTIISMWIPYPWPMFLIIFMNILMILGVLEYVNGGGV